VSCGTLLALFILWRAGHWALARLVFENPAFTIRNVEVQTDGAIRLELLRGWAGVKPQQNLLALDLARVKRDLELCSAIQSVAVERALPDTLRLRVFEREPIARIHARMPQPDGRGTVSVVYHIDSTGFVFIPLDRALRTTPPEADELPSLLGVNQVDLRPGRRAESPPVQAALQLIREFDNSPMAGLVSLQCIDCSSSEVLIVQTGQRSEITFAIRKLDQQMRRWRSIYDFGLRGNRAIASVDLSVGENIPARWQNESPVLPPPKPKSTSRSKKKNV
jgi:hypothetical protein